MDDYQKLNKRSSLRKSIRVPVIYGAQEDESRGMTLDLSETGLSIISEKHFNVGAGINLRIILDKDHLNSRAVVRHIYNNNDNRAVGLQFLDLSDNDRINLRQALDLPFNINVIDYTTYPYSLNLNPANHKVIPDKNFISLLFSQQHLEKKPIFIKPHLSEVSIPALITSFEIIGEKTRVGISRFEDGSRIDLTGYKELISFFINRAGCYVFKAAILHIERQSIYLEMPANIIQLWRRPHPGSRLDVTEMNIMANVISEADNKEYRLPVKDIGFGGLSMDLPDRNMAFAIDNAPFKIRLNLENDLNVSFSTNLRYINERSDGDKKTYTGGFAIKWIESGDKMKFEKFIIRQNYPYIVGFNAARIDKVWDLFFQSGYMIPEKRDYVDKVKNEIEETWASVYGDDSNIGMMLLFEDNDEIYGTIAITLSYDKTWVVHQLAAVKHPEVVAGRYLLECGILFLIEYLDLKNVKVYFRKDNTWAIDKLLKFQEFCTYKDAVLYIFKDLYEIDIDNYQNKISGISNVEVDYISNNDDCQTIIDYLSNTLPEIILQTDNINAEGLDLNESMERYIHTGVMRGRKVIVAKADGRIISFALLEFGSTGVNLGGLFDVFQIYTIQDGYEYLDEINGLLIEKIIGFYDLIGKKTVLCLSDDKYKNILERCGFVKTLEYTIWYIHYISLVQICHFINRSYITHIRDKIKIKV